MKDLVDDKVEVIKGWMRAGKIVRTDPFHLIFSIWATTQHYADFDVPTSRVQVLAHVLGGLTEATREDLGFSSGSRRDPGAAVQSRRDWAECSGHWVRAFEVIFDMIVDETLYLRLDEVAVRRVATSRRLAVAASEPEARSGIGTYSVPLDILDARDELLGWVSHAIECAGRGGLTTKRVRRSPSAGRRTA